MFIGKIVTKKISVIIFSIVLFFAFTNISSANYFSGGKSSGIFYVQYDSSVNTYGYLSIYDAGRESWNGISTKVKVDWTGSYCCTTDKYYVGTTADPTLLGTTAFYKASGGTFVPASTSETWAYSTVAIYDNNMDTYLMTTSQRVSNAAHEVGHSLSLDHTPSSGSASVMKTGIQSITPTTYDQGQLKLKWGN